MKPIHIAVSTKDMGFARAIARGLAEKGEGIFVRVLEPEAVREAALEAGERSDPDWEILVTDIDRQEGFAIPGAWTDRVVKLEGYAVSVKDVLDRIMETACGLGIGPAKGLRGKISGSPFIVGFYGRCGGCGVTSVALTTGRMLAGAFGERVLYLSFAPEDDAYLYGAGAQAGPGAMSDERPGRPGGRLGGLRAAEGRVGAQTGAAAGVPVAGAPTPSKEQGGGRGRSRKELLYRLGQKMPVHFEQYAQEDVYGLTCLRPTAGSNCFHFVSADERRMLLEQIVNVTEYDVILVDLGTETDLAQGCFHLLTEVRSRMDQRCLTDIPGEDAVVIWNHGTVGGAGGGSCRVDSRSGTSRSRDSFGGGSRSEGGFSGTSRSVGSSSVGGFGGSDSREDNRSYGALFEIAHDPESFRMENGGGKTEKEMGEIDGISIDMTKDFAIGVKNFSDFLEDFVLKAR